MVVDKGRTFQRRFGGEPKISIAHHTVFRKTIADRTSRNCSQKASLFWKSHAPPTPPQAQRVCGLFPRNCGKSKRGGPGPSGAKPKAGPAAGAKKAKSRPPGARASAPADPSGDAPFSLTRLALLPISAALDVRARRGRLRAVFGGASVLIFPSGSILRTERLRRAEPLSARREPVARRRKGRKCSARF